MVIAVATAREWLGKGGAQQEDGWGRGTVKGGCGREKEMLRLRFNIIFSELFSPEL